MLNKFFLGSLGFLFITTLSLAHGCNHYHHHWHNENCKNYHHNCENKCYEKNYHKKCKSCRDYLIKRDKGYNRYKDINKERNY